MEGVDFTIGTAPCTIKNQNHHHVAKICTSDHERCKRKKANSRLV